MGVFARFAGLATAAGSLIDNTGHDGCNGKIVCSGRSAKTIWRGRNGRLEGSGQKHDLLPLPLRVMRRVRVKRSYLQDTACG